MLVNSELVLTYVADIVAAEIMSGSKDNLLLNVSAVLSYTSHNNKSVDSTGCFCFGRDLKAVLERSNVLGDDNFLAGVTDLISVSAREAGRLYVVDPIGKIVSGSKCVIDCAKQRIFIAPRGIDRPYVIKVPAEIFSYPGLRFKVVGVR